MKTTVTLFSKYLLLTACLLGSIVQLSQAQYVTKSMAPFTKLHVAVVPFPRIAIENAINSYEFVGKLERRLLSIKANVVDATKASALVLVDVDLKPVTAGYVYFVRIRFLRKVEEAERSKNLIPATIWERKEINFCSKINIKKEMLASFEGILDDFISDYSEAHN